MILPTLKYENEAFSRGHHIIVGIDEAGRGPLAGPVVASAVFVNLSENKDMLDKLDEDQVKLIRDSKTLSVNQREKAFELINENFDIGIGWCDHQTIDRMNILQAAYLAMKKAVTDLRKKIEPDVDFILLDGNKKIPNFSYRQKAIINGDRFSFSIAAASIIAKVTRDRTMLDFHKKYPDYGFDRHKGYGTRVHLEALETHGPCPIHRRSFNRVSSSRA